MKILKFMEIFRRNKLKDFVEFKSGLKSNKNNLLNIQNINNIKEITMNFQ